ncbi:MAG TPA: pyruvate dehydrogenase (acetyl-transferring) E1 component subunit alpha [Gemmatimonadales bacterium]
MTVTAAMPVGAPPGRDHARDLLARMLLIRRFEERCIELYSQEKIRGFLHLYIGEEAVAVGAMQALTADDAVVATYREHGHALARDISPGVIMAEMFGKVSGCSRGRGGSMHLFDAARRFYGGYAIVGGGLPIAVGLALADRLQDRPGITACFFGDGAVAEGEFHESLNLATLWKLPVLFLCENNRYAMGTAIERHQASTNIAAKASAYGMTGEQVDGMDVLAVEAAVRQAAQQVRLGTGPVLLELLTYRFRAHSMYDPELYRSKDEVRRWMERDPIATFTARLRQWNLLDDAGLQVLEREAQAAVALAVEEAERGGLEPVEEVLRHVTLEATR